MEEGRVRAVAASVIAGVIAACSAPTPAVGPVVPSVPSDARSPSAPSAYVCSSIAVPSASPLPADASKAAVVRVETMGYVEPKRVCDYLHTKAGGAIDDQAIDADIRDLYGAGLFDDVTVARETVPGGVAIAFEMAPLKSFASTRLDGARGLPHIDESLLPPPGLLDPVMIHATRRSLEDNLAFGGYRHADVLVQKEPREDGGIELVFRVEANVQTHVRNVRIEGAAKLGESELKAMMESKPGAPASDEILTRDALVIAAAYYDHGMLQVKVSDPEMVESRDGAYADIDIRVQEGDVYRLGAVHVAGDLLEPEGEYLRHFITPKVGDVFSRSVIAADVDRIREYQRARGFPSDVEPETVLDPDKKRIDVTLKVTPSHAP